jgi:hypothetical protein
MHRSSTGEPSDPYLHGGGMIAGHVGMFDGPVI